MFSGILLRYELMVVLIFLHVVLSLLKANIQGAYQIHKYNNPQSAYALHILQNRHEYWTMQDTIGLLKSAPNVSRMNTLEQYHIQKYQYNNKLIQEQNSGEHNPLFEIAFNLQR
jgi:hypothetical protein